MSNRKKVVKMYHVRYVADFIVPATSNREAFEVADEEFADMIEGDQYTLEDIFSISIENDKFHIVEDADELDDEDADDNDEDFDDADELDDEDDEDDEDDDEDED